MKSLVLAEKPSVGRDIAKALNVTNAKNGYIENQHYIITWALGHLVTNATPEQYDKSYQQWRLEALPIIPKQMKTVVIGKTRKQFNTVQHLLKRDDVKEVIIATDAGREGELVARLILDKVRIKKPLKRLWISSVTPKAIQQGFRNLKDAKHYYPLYQAALARSEADWIVGINATRALTTRYDAQLSLGRVQTPTIKLIQQRQEEIKHFKPETYFTMEVKVDNLPFKLVQAQREFDKQKLNNLAETIQGQSIKIESIKEKEKKSYPGRLYNLTDIQQHAYQRYKISAKQTLNALQSLYERHKVLTYPRTDSNYLTTDMVGTLKERLQAVMGTEYKTHAQTLMHKQFTTKLSCINNQKVSDHHAIIPTEVRPYMDDLGAHEKKIYLLVVQRYLEVLSEPHIYIERQIIGQIGEATFIYKSNETKQLGFKALHHELPLTEVKGSMTEGERFDVTDVSILSHQTTPPAYFNEGTLLKAMERPDQFFNLNDKHSAETLKATGGIGTVATRADIIEKLFKMNAIESQDGKLKVTSKGAQILSLAPQALTSPMLTAKWEDKLLKIEKGTYQRQQFIDEMKQFTIDVIQTIKDSNQKYKHDNLTSAECPTCGKFMLKVKTKHGSMLVCQDPACKTKKDVKTQTKARCPKCKKRLTKFGTGGQATYRCVCGHTETQAQMNQRLKSKGKDKVSHRDMKKYMKDDELDHNPFKDAMKGLKL
ncbi:DNA topoisomerase III [Staphylococcus hyicus]|uniref:DNA topoisomerase III n=1 Tax=Staphylococcus hyicus TaxID=1284 RepID=UPI001431E975|nr:DNA topoisomerase III [Staphylococcus hyicus]NJH99932.1 DNA topoisomerase III [Staphylococcus hyicus]NJI31861.1 DNA topoisomerase III [Staphylococcus hyicus]